MSFSTNTSKTILKKTSNLSHYYLIPRRYRYKPKWAVNFKKETNRQLALSNFDAFYKPYYGKDWPSIRLSLLSLPKYTAVLNRYGNEKSIQSQLEDLDVINFTEYARILLTKQDNILTDTESVSEPPSDNKKLENSENVESEPDPVGFNKLLEFERDKYKQYREDGQVLEPYSQDIYKDSLNVFVPVDQIYTEKEHLLKEEVTMNTFRPRDLSIPVVPLSSLTIPSSINALVYPKGNVTLFPQPKAHSRIYNYYLMDAASVMPVIALNVQPADQVLDMCAAPGGKSFLILQSLDLDAGGSLLCNDISLSRLQRLKNVLFSHLPKDLAAQVQVRKADGFEALQPVYNKVLVDVPCNADRHAVTEEDNGLFKMSRTRERLDLMKTQQELLKTAIHMCVPGGDIVYSTCTLAPAQNDGVIQAVLEDLWQTSEIEVVVEDLRPLTKLFNHIFKFHQHSSYGQNIIPTITNNFGPSYFAKLKRIK
ncbi:5-methylcytosine rRNA methyltransferase NSUN4-like [Physella acuta]|uniref:5-methylcytosine rRNA methyltransferase NSUN4-like n=1 Tax=Physella acuta TaxID=109671 RepID=UPI0027DDBEB8|nr:5-methylcytosine rRNA methyltransferase NSUN4-like [Physella acuta]